MAALDHSEKRALADLDGSICESFSSENSGRLSRVDGTDSETARGRRAEENAAFGLMSRMRQAGSLMKESRLTGRTGEKVEGVTWAEVFGWWTRGGLRVMDAMGVGRLMGLTAALTNLDSIARANESVCSTCAVLDAAALDEKKSGGGSADMVVRDDKVS